MFAVAYGIARITCDEYYSNFGITPEDVGLTQLAMVAKAGYLFAVVIGLVGSAIAAVVLGLTVARVPARRFHHVAPEASFRQQFWNTLITTVIPSLLILALLSLFVRLLFLRRATTFGGINMQDLGVIDGTCLFVAAIFGWMASVSAAHGRAPSTGWWQEVWGEFKSAQVKRVLAASSVVVTLGVAIFALVNGLTSSADSDAHSLIAQGKTPSSLSSFAYTPSFSAEVIPLGNDPAHICSRHGILVLLGNNGQTSYVLLRPNDDTTETAAVLSIRNDQYALALGSPGNEPCAPTTSLIKRSAS
jgi:hypothetical protein